MNKIDGENKLPLKFHLYPMTNAVLFVLFIYQTVWVSMFAYDEGIIGGGLFILLLLSVVVIGIIGAHVESRYTNKVKSIIKQDKPIIEQMAFKDYSLYTVFSILLLGIVFVEYFILDYPSYTLLSWDNIIPFAVVLFIIQVRKYYKKSKLKKESED